MTLHEKIAKVLGWSERNVKSFSLLAMRELVRTVPPSKLRDEVIAEINAAMSSGRVVAGRL